MRLRPLMEGLYEVAKRHCTPRGPLRMRNKRPAFFFYPAVNYGGAEGADVDRNGGVKAGWPESAPRQASLKKHVRD